MRTRRELCNTLAAFHWPLCIDPSPATVREAMESVLDSAELQARMRAAHGQQLR
jgi:ribulose-5-phosphate 4-epimerase/fuculose-1-phosphate aldolase